MARQYRMISADSHVNEPPHLWQTRVPARFKERAPRMQRFAKGDAWIIEGSLDPINFGLNQCASDPTDENSGWIKWENCRRGGFDPAARIQELDLDGVDAELLYPTPRVGNGMWWNNKDQEFHLACIRAYNDWLSEEYASREPDRLFGLAMMPTTGVEDALGEFERGLALPGIKGIVLGRYPSGTLAIGPQDDPFWAAAEERRVPINIHVSMAAAPAGDHSRSLVSGEYRFLDAPVRALEFIYTGVFDRFPNLQVVFAEVDCGWVPYVKEQIDRVGMKPFKKAQYHAKKTPRYYFDNNLSFVYINDPVGIAVRHMIGVDRMLWSTDHAHSASHWPHTQEFLAEHLAGVPEEEKHKMLAGNAQRLYGI